MVFGVDVATVETPLTWRPAAAIGTVAILAADRSTTRHRHGRVTALIFGGLLQFLVSPIWAHAELDSQTECDAPQKPAFGAVPAPDIETAHRQAMACYNRGVAHEQAARYDQAIADLTSAIRLDPGFIAAFASRGVAYDQKGFYDRAIADYTHAIAATDPANAQNLDLAETYFNRGAAYEHHRLYRQAVADYRAALKLDPSLQPPRDGIKRLGGGP